jgi:hypothetical protein
MSVRKRIYNRSTVALILTTSKPPIDFNIPGAFAWEPSRSGVPLGRCSSTSCSGFAEAQKEREREILISGCGGTHFPKGGANCPDPDYEAIIDIRLKDFWESTPNRRL